MILASLTITDLILIDWIIIVIFIIIGMGCLSYIGIYLEKKDFNNGTCPYCNIPLRHFDNDSQGGRLYTCDRCKYYCSVSWNIDKDYKEGL